MLANRREFTKDATLVFLSGVSVAITGCGGSGGATAPPPPTTTPAVPPGGEAGEVSANHGHVATVTSVQLRGGGAILGLDIRGGATHPHSIDLPSQAVVDIREGRPVQVQSSSNDGHDHLVTFNAESPVPPTRY
jgi:hypothetical protein